MIIFIFLAFDAKYEVNIEDDILINIFGNEFFKEIQNNLDYMKNRKIILIVCAFVAFIALFVQLVMVIINHINEKKERNNNFNMQPQVVYSVENFESANVNNEPAKPVSSEKKPKAEKKAAKSKSSEKKLDLNKPYEEMSVEELQACILEKLAKNGPVTDRMRKEVAENIYPNSLLNWVKSFR